MKNSELNQLSILELRDLNKRVVEMMKLKMQIEGRLNADNLEVGMTVKYKGSTTKLLSEKFIIQKISKVNAQCKNIRTGVIWNIKLCNIEPIETTNSGDNQPIYEREGESGFHA